MPPRELSHPSRREFVQGVTIGTSLAAAGLPLHGAEPVALPQAAGTPDFTGHSAALQPDRIVASACQFCNSDCRLHVHLKAGRVIDVRGEPADPVQAGELCVKAAMMPQLVYNRHRLTRPLKRVGGTKGSPDSKFEPVSWDEALALIARKFLELRDAGEAR